MMDKHRGAMKPPDAYIACLFITHKSSKKTWNDKDNFLFCKNNFEQEGYKQSS